MPAACSSTCCCVHSAWNSSISMAPDPSTSTDLTSASSCPSDMCPASPAARSSSAERLPEPSVSSWTNLRSSASVLAADAARARACSACLRTSDAAAKASMRSSRGSCGDTAAANSS